VAGADILVSLRYARTGARFPSRSSQLTTISFLVDSTMRSSPSRNRVLCSAHRRRRSRIIAVERDENGQSCGSTANAGRGCKREARKSEPFPPGPPTRDAAPELIGAFARPNDCAPALHRLAAMRARSTGDQALQLQPPPPANRRVRRSQPFSCNGCAPTISPSLACANIASRPTSNASTKLAGPRPRHSECPDVRILRTRSGKMVVITPAIREFMRERDSSLISLRVQCEQPFHRRVRWMIRHQVVYTPNGRLEAN